MSTVSDALSWWLAKKGEDRVDATVAAAHAAAAAAAGSSHSITAGTGAAENSGKILYYSSLLIPHAIRTCHFWINLHVSSFDC